MPIVGKPVVRLQSTSKTLAGVRPALSSADVARQRLETLAQKRPALPAAGGGVEVPDETPDVVRGGGRAGAGRPLLDSGGALIKLSVTLSARNVTYLDSEAERLGVNRSAVLRGILNRMR